MLDFLVGNFIETRFGELLRACALISPAELDLLRVGFKFRARARASRCLDERESQAQLCGAGMGQSERKKEKIVKKEFHFLSFLGGAAREAERFARCIARGIFRGREDDTYITSGFDCGEIA